MKNKQFLGRLEIHMGKILERGIERDKELLWTLLLHFLLIRMDLGQPLLAW